MNEFAGYLDDSGHPDQDLVVAAGFVGKEEQWLLPDTEWKCVLQDCALRRDPRPQGIPQTIPRLHGLLSPAL